MIVANRLPFGCGVGRRALLMALLTVVGATTVEAQPTSGRRLEGRILREASALEANGDLPGAERTLRDLLRRQPTSSAAVFALGRVLTSAERPAEILPVADTYLKLVPGTIAVWSLKVRVLAEVDSLDAIAGTVQDWLRAAPGSSDPYREGSRVLHATDGFGSEAALRLLEEGLQRLGDPPGLLIEVGEIHFSEGRVADGAKAWAQALGQDRVRTGEIRRRLLQMKEADRQLATAEIVQILGREPTTVARLEAGAELALRVGIQTEALTLAQAAVSRLDRREASVFLNDFARRAEGADRLNGAIWAYEKLRQMTDGVPEKRSADERLATVALAASDTAVAIAARERIVSSYRKGSAERHAAWGDELDLRVAHDAPLAAMDALTAFRDEYPESPSLDGLSAALASRLLVVGEREAALTVLEGLDGSGAALERAYLLLEGGAMADGIAALQTSLPDLQPAQATQVLDLMLALGRLTPVGSTLAAQVAVSLHRKDFSAGVELLALGLEDTPQVDWPTLLALGAQASDQAGLTDQAESWRRRIVTDFPAAPEYPAAAVRLARSIASRPANQAEAVRILEELIVAYPTSPSVPEARRALQRILAGSPVEGDESRDKR